MFKCEPCPALCLRLRKFAGLSGRLHFPTVTNPNANDRTQPKHMKTNPFKSATVLCLAAFLSAFGLHAATFAWTNLVAGSASGSWTNQANWNPNSPPSTNDTADFSTLNITANSTVGLTNGNQTVYVNSMVFGDADTSSAAGWTVTSSGNLQSLTLAGSNPTIIVNALGTGAGVTNNLVLAGSGFIKDGSGLLSLNGSGANIFTGSTYITNGTLVLSKSDNTAAVSGDLTVGTNTVLVATAKNQLAFSANLTNYGYFNSGGKTLTVNSLVLDNNGVITNSSSSVYITNATTYDVRSGVIYPNLAGAAGLTKSTAGTVVLTNGGGANIYTGNTTVNGGILLLGHSGAGQGLPGTTVTVNAGGTLMLGKDTQINPNATVDINAGTFELLAHTEEFGTLILENSGSISNGGNTSKTLLVDTSMDFRSGLCASRLGGSGLLTKSTAGTVILTMDNTNNGGVLISAGILQLGDGSVANRGQFGSGPVTNNAAVVLNHAGSFNITNVIGGTGSVTNLGGTATFTAANSYSGGTVVSGGTLLVNNTSGSGTGSGAVSVQSGAALGGTGTLGGNVTIASNGTLSPGSGGIGTLAVNGSLSLGANSTNTFDVNGTTPANDSVVLGSSVTYGGVLNIKTNGTFAANEKFVLFSGTGATNTGNFASIAGSPGPNLAFTFTNGVLSVVSVASAPPQLSFTQTGSTLNFSWTDATYKLQSQTNSLATGLAPNGWSDYPGGGTSPVNGVTVDPKQPTVFFRLSQ